MQIYVAHSWKCVGHSSLSLVSALSLEVSFSHNAHLASRADGVAHVAMLETLRKGPAVGKKIIEHINK